MKYRVFLMLLSGLLMLPPSISAQPSEDSLTELLSEAQDLLSQGQTLTALERLQAAIEMASELETRNLVLEEEVRWQSAMAHQEFADQLTNRNQIRHYARSARDLWLAYIDWFHSLTPQQRSTLPTPHRRVVLATRHLGNANTRLGDLDLLFADYANIPELEFLGIDALQHWKSMLYRCPDWQEHPERSFELRSEKICHFRCGQEWLTYADAIELWATEAPISRIMERRYSREASQVRETAESCRE